MAFGSFSGAKNTGVGVGAAGPCAAAGWGANEACATRVEISSTRWTVDSDEPKSSLLRLAVSGERRRCTAGGRSRASSAQHHDRFLTVREATYRAAKTSALAPSR